MNIHPIRTEDDHRAALRDPSAYFNDEPAPGTPDGDRFEVLLTLVESYEAKHFPVDAPDPIEAIKFRLEQAGLSKRALAPSIGEMSRVHEILTGKRNLTLPMIRKLHKNLGIPTDSLIGVSR